jgi:DNA-binding NtrC family response regulator
MLAQALADDGHRVVVGSNGDDLVAYITRSLSCSFDLVDLVVSDIRMPGCSGLVALERLERSKGVPPVLLMTAFGDDDVHNVAARLGAVGVIDKPFDVDDFRTVVLNLVDRGQQGQLNERRALR